MGNCQAIDAATLVIQHPCGKVDKLYWSVPASQIMKMNPGHYVALLITTTVCHANTTPKPENNSPIKHYKHQKCSTNNQNDSTNSQKNNSNSSKGSDNMNSNISKAGGPNTLRITRVKLLRPTDIMALGHVYRLISAKEVMKGMIAKKQAKMRENGIELADSDGLKEAEKLVRRSHQEKTHQASRHGHRSRTSSTLNGGTTRPKTWQPSLHSISESVS